MRSFILLLLPLLFLSKPSISSRSFHDPSGRTLFYHGVNAIYKTFPFYPDYQTFTLDTSLSSDDFQRLRSWGMNFIRLYVGWEGLEPIKGQYNFTLLQEIKNIVRLAKQFNFTVLLDAHQDLLSKKFCGEGMPDWAVLSNSSFPRPVADEIIRDENGYPVISECLKTLFAKFYFAYDITQTFDDLYENKDGIAESFAEFWKMVASEFKDEDNVIGYEIINEPFFGNFYNHFKELLYPGYTDLYKLQPLYDRVSEKIRLVDNETIIFFEPNVLDIPYIGFTHGPGGEIYKEKQVLSFHIYCGASSPTSKFDNYKCKFIDWLLFKPKLARAEGLGIPSFLTEFGAVKDSIYESSELSNVAGRAEENLVSWAYWQYKGYNDITTAGKSNEEGFYNEDGSLQTSKVKALARTYAYAVTGKVEKNYFEADSGKFELIFKWKKCSLNTEIYVSEEFYYRNGLKYKIEGCNVCQLRRIAERFYFELVGGENLEDGSKIRILIHE